MRKDTEDILTTLKFELEFIRANGYAMSTRSPWREPSLFLDSPSCLNFTASVGVRPCKECELHYFVPAEDASKTIPCHHIPLNEAKDTVDSLEWETDQKGIQLAVEKWLCDTIARLEQQEANEVIAVSPAAESKLSN
jgi:hypothetical protein